MFFIIQQAGNDYVPVLDEHGNMQMFESVEEAEGYAKENIAFDYDIYPVKTARVKPVLRKFFREIHDDVIERLDGLQSFVSTGDNFELIYHTQILKRLLEDEEDDTSETTRYRIEKLYKEALSCGADMVLIR